MTHLDRIAAGQGIGPLYLFSTTRNPEGNRNHMTSDPAATLAWLLLAHELDNLTEQGRPTPCQVDPLPYFDEDRQVRAEAAAACRGCPVTDLCAAYADAAQEPAWVWGGRDRAPGRGARREQVAG